MKSYLTFLIVALLTGCATTRDPIDQLAARLSSDHSWEQGGYRSLGLPPTASIEQVVSRVLEWIGSNQGPVTTHEILQVRAVRIAGSLPGMYTAVLVDTNRGRKIVLLNQAGPGAEWWYRVFDDDTSRTMSRGASQAGNR